MGFSAEVFRVCPECNQRAVRTSEIFPDGTGCLHCLKHIETDATFYVLLIVALLVVSVVDYRFYQSGAAYICGALLIIFGGPMKWSLSRFIPLRHYEDTE